MDETYFTELSEMEAVSVLGGAWSTGACSVFGVAIGLLGVSQIALGSILAPGVGTAAGYFFAGVIGSAGGVAMADAGCFC